MKRLKFFIALLILFVISFNGQIILTPYKFPELNYFPKMPSSEVNTVTVEGADLGRHLFYDPILSSDSSISCSSCHKQEFAFSDSPNSYSVGRNNIFMKRNTMPLFNLAWYPAYFWDGSASTIEAQIFHPITSIREMNMSVNSVIERINQNKYYKKKFYDVFQIEKIDSAHIAYAISQFLRTLISYQSKYDKVIGGNGRFTDDEFEGYNLLNDQTKGDCLHCHTTDADALGTTLKFSNNGLDVVLNVGDYSDVGRGGVTGKNDDIGKFIIPSLRNLAFTAPYMHDGRFKTINEVIDFYSDGVKQCVNIDSKMEFAHQGGAKLSIDEKRKIVSFLLTLSDSSFTSNPEFRNPW